MGLLIASNKLRDIFTKKIYGTNQYLVSKELVAYLMWLIYVSPFKNYSNVAHEDYYNTKVAYLKKAA